ncbi:MAG: peptidase prolyl oligopeptidase active site domain protein [Actinoallomurus sp.]|nr:peptidase prolyl oligopeptidase active site domain protein [Actinoallomurus sp.]
MTPFHDLGDYMALPRVLGLRLSADGSRLVAVVQALAPDGKTYRTALWRVDPDGVEPPRRLTRSAEGEKGPAFLPDGSLLFTSSRTDGTGEDKDEDEERHQRLWLLPADGGEPWPAADHPGGIEEFAVARDSGTVVLAAPTLPGPDDGRRDRRRAAGVTATLHETLPVRDWDHQLGPAERRLYVTPPPADAGPGTHRDLTPEPGQALTGQAFAITPDGATVVTGWWVPEGRGGRRSELVAIDTATGERRRLAAAEDADFASPAVSPDGSGVVCVRQRHATIEEPPDETLWFVPLDGGEGRDLTPGLDRWPYGPVWAPDGRTAYFGAYDHGRAPVFSVEVATGEVARLTGDDADYNVAAVSPDGRHVYALRSAIDAPPAPVRLKMADPARGPEPRRLKVAEAAREPEPLGFSVPDLPGRVTEVTATTPDGVPIRGWLVLPAEASAASPAPLLLWPHGGPHSSWSAWTWRWSPWVMAAHGYAVLLPDPALSLGYGQDFVRRGHGRWGAPAYDDLMAITDATVARDDIDEARTAVMGGSYGGYMANWIAGHTDRFNAIVTHASAWPLVAMAASDEAYYFLREFGDPAERPERWAAEDPARHIANIRTPMLVIHGDRDYRVPIGNALTLWSDLVRHGVEAKFLYFPDENHWILTPGNATVWYETVLAFLAQHVLGEKWRSPELL